MEEFLSNLGTLGIYGIAIGIFGVIMFLTLCSCFYLLMRPFVLWYFKINKIKHEQEKTNFLLEKILEELEHGSVVGKESNVPRIEDIKQKDYSDYMPK